MKRKILARSGHTATVTVGVPAWASVVLAVIATGLQVINQLALAGHGQIQAVITVILVFLAAEHITPLHGNLAVLIHLPKWVGDLLAALAAAAAGVLQIVGTGTTAHVIVLAVVTLLAGLGFGGSQGELLLPPTAVR